jgi:hypothetical protein
MQTPDIRYEAARVLFAKLKGCPLADARLERWVLPSDRHLPSSLIALPLSEVLTKPYSALQRTKGVGEAKLEKLVFLIERALNELTIEGMVNQSDCQDPQASDTQMLVSAREQSLSAGWSSTVDSMPNGKGLTLGDVTDQNWALICKWIKDHGLEHLPLGRIAEKLEDMPRGLWHCPLSDFVEHPIGHLISLKGYGEHRINSVLGSLASLALLLDKCQTKNHLCIRVCPSRIEKLSIWISDVLKNDLLPDYAALCQNFVFPLLQQMRDDLGSQTAEMIERRLGVQAVPGTLQDIAASYMITRERVRQLTSQASVVIGLRWPEGRHLLSDLFNKLNSNGDAVRQADLIARTLDHVFDMKAHGGISREEVMQVWENAGRLKETPMTENEILVLLAGRFPELAPSVGLRWITDESASVDYEGRRLFFSNDQSDRFLHQLYQSRRAIAITDIPNLDDREARNFRTKIQRDLRFTKDENHCFIPTEFSGFNRDSIGWYAQLEPASPNVRPTRTFVSVESIVNLALGGFHQLGVVDVTIWGFHRFVNEQLSLLYDARLVESVNAYVLGDMVIRQSGRRIREMRRRRLRWDKGGSMIARGKRGWVGFVVQQAGIPIVLDELRGMLRRHYQDYESSVIDQLSLENDEEGESEFGVTLFPGIPHKLMPILVPNGWSLEYETDNTSDGVRLAVARAVKHLQEGRITLSELQHIPWFIAMIQRNSYGTDLQDIRENRRTMKTPKEIELVDQNDRTRSDDFDALPCTGEHAQDIPQKVSDLLQRFL